MVRVGAGGAAAALALRPRLRLAVHPDCGTDARPTEEEGCVPIEQGNNDPAYVHDVANLLADGHPYVDPTVFRLTGEGKPTAHKMPLFPAVLALPSLVGADGAQAHRVVGPCWAPAQWWPSAWSPANWPVTGPGSSQRP